MLRKNNLPAPAQPFSPGEPATAAETDLGEGGESEDAEALAPDAPESNSPGDPAAPETPAAGAAAAGVPEEPAETRFVMRLSALFELAGVIIQRRSPEASLEDQSDMVLLALSATPGQTLEKIQEVVTNLRIQRLEAREPEEQRRAATSAAGRLRSWVV